MNRYTIYCTEEQTKKALELGAPIKIECFSTASEDHWHEVIPTAEQMIGWLEENTEIERVNIVRGIDSNYYWDIFTWKKIASSYSGYTDGDFSRKEATLAAIDAALEYLSNNKK